jgi:Restriction endonuclease
MRRRRYRRRRRAGKSAGGGFLVVAALAFVVIAKAEDLSRSNPFRARLIWAGLIAGMVLLAFLAIRRAICRSRALRAIDLERIDTMSGVEFELYVMRIFAFQGYRVKHTGHAGDQGCDLILSRSPNIRLVSSSVIKER